MKESAEIVIVGSGTAGLSALREVRRHTDDVLLINHGGWGTTCAAVGCMPSKALIEAADAFHRRTCFEEFGIRGGDALRADIPAVLERVRRLRDDFVKGPESVRTELRDRAISGFARLLGPDRVEVDGRQIRARRIILATGSHPIVPKPWQRFGDRILTSDTIFEQRDLPKRLAVIGLGPLGIELAQAVARLGVEVAGFDGNDSIGGVGDPEVQKAAARTIGAEFPLHLGQDAEVTEDGDALRVTAGDASFTTHAVLAALGRAPNVEGLGLETLGVPLDDHGLPEVSPATLRIGDLPVWLVGDANGARPILHEAADDGHIAGRLASSARESGFQRRTNLSIVFTEPNIAQVGRTWRDHGGEGLIVGAADFPRQGRARTACRDAGVLRLYAEPESGRLVGAEMCCPGAEHMAHLLALAIEAGQTVGCMLSMPFYHPTLEEGVRTALRALSRQLPGLGGSDLAECPDIGIEALD
ncbi:dihydrolipoyl dehydrogenase [Tranquillimonas alkanivorans]|uniref:Dihydrolipoamide dehydrogenase n=1 Tax=Tranquillimonas alkanivorans TaxID=441119 RepID=A0A1I5T043_9RHOB|nr:dihydrolipoyl dehydrogenase [Tranquillimonas alkanivorans]SFP76392.1 dihydrolipoamide dehydrogenase [Tranquillimonas alkanivorans]